MTINESFRRVQFIRKAFQMTAVTVILVLVISIVIVVTTGSPVPTDVDCSPVSNLRVEEEDLKLIISWDPPIGDDCNRNKIVLIHVYENGKKVVNSLVQDTWYEIKKNSCAYYRIIVYSTNDNGYKLLPNEIQHKSGIAGTGLVNNLRVTDNVIRWDEPDNYEPCELEYEIVINSENLVTQNITTSEREFSVDLIPCSNKEISVRSIANDQLGAPKSIQKYGPVRMDPPSHRGTDPQSTGAIVFWSVENEEDNACVPDKIKFEFLGEQNDKPIDFRSLDFDENGKYTIEDLSEGTRHRYAARWIIDDETNSDLSNEIEFKTLALTEPEITHTDFDINDDNDGQMTITWEQKYEADFVTRHELIVTNLGPQHFLPDYCDTGETVVFNDTKLAGDLTTISVSPVFPNFQYKIEIITHFDDLLMQRNTIMTETIDSQTPGEIKFDDLDIRVGDYEPGTPYKDINVIIKWNVQCDLNGELDHYHVKINGKFKRLGYNDDCSINFYDNKVKRIGNQEEYSVEVVGLLPFFEYTIEIVTVTEEGNHSSTSTFKNIEIHLPVAHFPPNQV